MKEILSRGSSMPDHSDSPLFKKASPEIYYLLFFLSGFPALLYQIVWQRALFTAYGINIESVTIIVTVFMLGLGLGSLAGGRLSMRPGLSLLLAFGMIELSIGAFGCASLAIFHRVASLTAGASATATGLIAFALLLIPTLLMGSTLPLLVEHFVRRTGSVGASVGSLYAVNTFGSAVACLFASLFVMRLLGESGSLRLAAALNLIVGGSALILYLRGRHAIQTPTYMDIPDQSQKESIPFVIGMFLAGAVGFVSLAYEIIWYRLYSFVTGGTAHCFAMLLAYYLFGIAFGSLKVHDLCQKELKNDLRLTLKKASNAVMLGTIVAFLLGPELGRQVVLFHGLITYAFVFVAAALMGAAFPLFCHAAIDATRESGKKLSYLYLSNIIGSALGSFGVGFVLLDYWSTKTVSLVLLGMGVSIAFVLAVLSHSVKLKSLFAVCLPICLVLGLFSGPLYSNLYERLLYKDSYNSGMKFANLVENRSGVIEVDSEGTVFGGGVYDGRYNTDLLNDTNGIIRPFADMSLHRNPRQILIIGLSSGSWAQVVANNAAVEQVTIIEINPGYLPLIRQRACVASLLANPKVHIVIDDGRRWLMSNPDKKFDMVVMNSSFNWRANASNLLSTDFLRLIRTHLNPGGIHFYNTTYSEEALATGVAVFPYALRINGFLAVSDSPIKLDKDMWRSELARYRIDGRPVVDLSDPAQKSKLEEIVSQADTLDKPNGLIESRASLSNRLKGTRLITDDNMGTEWR